MTVCNWVDPVEGECTSVGVHMRRFHDGYSMTKQMLCEKHWEVVVDDEYSKVLLDLQHLVDKLLATPVLSQEKWARRYKALDEEMQNLQEALQRMAK